MAAKQCKNDYPVYRLTQPANGVNTRFWNAGDGDSVAHDDAANIWVGATDPTTGFPSHLNPPTVTVIESDWSVATNNIGGTAYPSDGSDQLEVWGWIDTTSLGPVLIRDNNANIGERGEVWVGACCGTPIRQPGFAEGTDTTTGSNGLLDPVQLEPGVHFVYGRLSDLSAFGGFDIEYTTDLSGTAGWVNIPAGLSFTDKPVVECLLVGGCDPVPAGYSLCPPDLCSPVIAPAGAGPEGPQGEQGIQGLPGPPGADGDSPTVTVTTETVCCVVGWANINQNGQVVAECGGVTASRTATGTYALTPPAGAQTVQLTVLETNTLDSIEIHPSDFVGSVVTIHEGDNGTAANVLRNRDFTAVWYGECDRVTNVEVTP